MSDDEKESLRDNLVNTLSENLAASNPFGEGGSMVVVVNFVAINRKRRSNSDGHKAVVTLTYVSPDDTIVSDTDNLAFNIRNNVITALTSADFADEFFDPDSLENITISIDSDISEMTTNSTRILTTTTPKVERPNTTRAIEPTTSTSTQEAISDAIQVSLTIPLGNIDLSNEAAVDAALREIKEALMYLKYNPFGKGGYSSVDVAINAKARRNKNATAEVIIHYKPSFFNKQIQIGEHQVVVGVMHSVQNEMGKSNLVDSERLKHVVPRIRVIGKTIEMATTTSTPKSWTNAESSGSSVTFSTLAILIYSLL